MKIKKEYSKSEMKRISTLKGYDYQELLGPYDNPFDRIKGLLELIDMQEKCINSLDEEIQRLQKQLKGKK